MLVRFLSKSACVSTKRLQNFKKVGVKHTVVFLATHFGGIFTLEQDAGAADIEPADLEAEVPGLSRSWGGGWRLGWTLEGTRGKKSLCRLL